MTGFDVVEVVDVIGHGGGQLDGGGPSAGVEQLDLLDNAAMESFWARMRLAGVKMGSGRLPTPMSIWDQRTRI